MNNIWFKFFNPLNKFLCSKEVKNKLLEVKLVQEELADWEKK